MKNSKELPVNFHEKGKFYLTENEVEQLILASKNSRHPIRNSLMILMMFRHGLRVSELINLRIKSINFENNLIWINRLKGGLSLEHPILGDEKRAIKRYLRTREKTDNSPYLFINERMDQFSRKTINYIIKTAAKKATLDNVHPHTLRHSCGYYMANKGTDLRTMQDYLGHRDPKHTVIYTQISGSRFESIWE